MPRGLTTYAQWRAAQGVAPAAEIYEYLVSRGLIDILDKDGLHNSLDTTGGFPPILLLFN